MSRGKVLVLTEQFKNGDPVFEPLRQAGYEVDVNETGRLPDEEELIQKLSAEVVATIAGGEPYTARVFKHRNRLQIVARWGVGYDRVDVAAATRARVPVAMAFGANHESVAEYALAMALALACQIGSRDAKVRGGGWAFDGFHPGLWGRTAGIVGFGRIGQAMVRRCRAGAMEVLVADPFTTVEAVESAGARRVEIPELLRASDLVSIHAPSNAATRHLFDAAALAQMKPTAILVNTARGALVDEAALAEALAEGRLGGAGLDVYEVEPLPPGSPLRQLDNVILSPHVSGMDRMAQCRVTERCVSNVLEYLGGRPEAIRPYVVNPEVLAPNQD
ncbi:MAG TPA: phosphoglycerate dehydrogenase [Anaeromyxobacteraceae bacterium]|nr:phosphoglycerate dehydrogenase [Anaeromyxobacteraceae bacterium]